MWVGEGKGLVTGNRCVVQTAVFCFVRRRQLPQIIVTAGGVHCRSLLLSEVCDVGMTIHLCRCEEVHSVAWSVKGPRAVPQA